MEKRPEEVENMINLLVLGYIEGKKPAFGKEIKFLLYRIINDCQDF